MEYSSQVRQSLAKKRSQGVRQVLAMTLVKLVAPIRPREGQPEIAELQHPAHQNLAACMTKYQSTQNSAKGGPSATGSASKTIAEKRWTVTMTRVLHLLLVTFVFRRVGDVSHVAQTVLFTKSTWIMMLMMMRAMTLKPGLHLPAASRWEPTPPQSQGELLEHFAAVLPGQLLAWAVPFLHSDFLFQFVLSSEALTEDSTE